MQQKSWEKYIASFVHHPTHKRGCEESRICGIGRKPLQDRQLLVGAAGNVCLCHGHRQHKAWKPGSYRGGVTSAAAAKTQDAAARKVLLEVSRPLMCPDAVHGDVTRN